MPQLRFHRRWVLYFLRSHSGKKKNLDSLSRYEFYCLLFLFPNLFAWPEIDKRIMNLFFSISLDVGIFSIGLRILYYGRFYFLFFLFLKIMFFYFFFLPCVPYFYCNLSYTKCGGHPLCNNQHGRKPHLIVMCNINNCCILKEIGLFVLRTSISILANTICKH